MPVDLTRFDFYAKNFIHSDNIRAMSLEEIGQYIILLCESWLTGKDCTLPEDPKTLSNLCRGSKVTNKVLDMFPVVPELGRRRNDRLYEEWLTAVKRSEDGKAAVQARWNGGNTTVIRPYDIGNTPSEKLVLPKPSQANPNQINPSQEECDFRNITIKYRTGIGNKHSKSKWFREKYEYACRQFGEEAVLAEFEDWAESNKWRSDSLKDTGLRFFFSDLPELIEESAAVRKMETAPAAEQVEIDSVKETANAIARQEFERRHAEIEAEQENLKNLPNDQF